MAKSNLVVVGLCEDLTKKIAEKLSSELNLYLADFGAIVEYEIENEQQVAKLCGIEYLEHLKSKIFDDVVQFENSLIYFPFSV